MHTADAIDMLICRVRTLRAFLTDEEVVKKLVEEKAAGAGEVYLAIMAARQLDGDVFTPPAERE